MKKVLSLILILTILLSSTVAAFADTGPKPSVVVDFKGLIGETFYVTLLSQQKSTGPHSAFDGTNARYQAGDPEFAIWQKFAGYKDKDGYYFLQTFEDCSKSLSYRWGYYPPSNFKVLIYFPEYNTFTESEVYERYAFDSYFTIDMKGHDYTKPTDKQETVFAVESYDHKWEIISLVARAAATIVLEVVIALFFGLTSKKQLIFITLVNIVTQVGLNTLLYTIDVNSGYQAFTFYYAIFEVLVIIIEAILYVAFLKRFTKKKTATVGKTRAIIYSIVANTASFGVGLWLAHLIPGIF